MTNDIRTVQAIESTIRQRVNRSHNHGPGSTEELRIAMLQADLGQTLRVFDGHRYQLTTAHTSIPGSAGRALRRLISGAVPQDELASVIEGIVSNAKAKYIVEFLQERDARMFIDVMDKVWVASRLSEELARS